MKRVELFWDVGSPYTYLATTQIAGLAERTSATVELRPFLLGGVFKATANHMPAEVQAKARYMLQDLDRWRERYGVRFSFPSIFPINSLLPMRVACALEGRDSERFCHAIMAAYWVDGLDAGTEPVVRGVLDGLALDAGATVARAQTQEVKDRLRKNTEEAVARGAFGAPTFFVGDQMFWGNDRLDFVEAALA
jgi:2-hydroxychromene-2-carboxylate isomerase